MKGERRLWLYTWGRENNLLSNIEQQRQLGVDGIIYDRWVKPYTQCNERFGMFGTCYINYRELLLHGGIHAWLFFELLYLALLILNSTA